MHIEEILPRFFFSLSLSLLEYLTEGERESERQDMSCTERNRMMISFSMRVRANQALLKNECIDA